MTTEALCDSLYSRIRDAFPTERECWPVLSRARHYRPPICPRCGAHGPRRRWERCTCKACNYSYKVTAGCFLDGSHQPLGLWFFLIAARAVIGLTDIEFDDPRWYGMIKAVAVAYGVPQGNVFDMAIALNDTNDLLNPDKVLVAKILTELNLVLGTALQ